MSYIRAGHDLYDFEGESESYVFESCGVSKDSPTFVEDYGDDYKDNASLAQLLINFMRRVTDDEKYITKMIGVLAEKLDVKIREEKENE